MKTQYQNNMQLNNRIGDSSNDFRLFPSADFVYGVKGVKLKNDI